MGIRLCSYQIRREINLSAPSKEKCSPQNQIIIIKWTVCAIKHSHNLHIPNVMYIANLFCKYRTLQILNNAFEYRCTQISKFCMKNCPIFFSTKGSTLLYRKYRFAESVTNYANPLSTFSSIARWQRKIIPPRKAPHLCSFPIIWSRK
jgi:hypothetical protein